MTETGDETAIRAARLVSQLLAGPPAHSVEAVVGRLLAVQAQDARGFRLSVRSRSTGVVGSDVDHALSTDRSIIVTWLNRGTLHLVAAADYWWLHPLTTPQLTAGNERRLGQEGVSAAQVERGVDVVQEAVTSDGPQTREQLRDRLDAAGIPTARQALVHVLVAATLRGHVVRGPMVGGHQAFVSVPDWLGAAPPALNRDAALAMLTRRYLAGHGPAAAADLAKWAGVTLGDARLGFDAVTDELVPMGPGFVLRGDRDRSTVPFPPPRLLGPFDPLLHGWKSRAPFVGRHSGIVTTNGIFRPVALVDGRVVGRWSLAGGIVTLTLLEPLARRTRDALVDDAAKVLRYLELPDRPAVVIAAGNP